MTNHHCGRNYLRYIQINNEDLLRDGFYANSLKEERKIKGLFVDQLISIEDVTEEIITAFNSGTTDKEKIQNRTKKIKELEDSFAKETDLICRVITLYNGGKYSMYMYKRYNDIRLVMAPDFQIAATGWDWDNFTYPRYELDFMFFRAYDKNGNPIKTKHFFRFANRPAKEGELIFTVGRPGNTDRLLSMAELEYFRDYVYPQRLEMYNGIYNIYRKFYDKYPEKRSQMLNMVMGIGNGRKSYAGRLMGLRDKYLMTKKKRFEESLIKKINSDPKLKSKYGFVWESIKRSIDEIKKLNLINFYNTYSRNYPVYFSIAHNVITYANQMKLPPEKRNAKFKNLTPEKLADLFFNKKYDEGLNLELVAAHANFLDVFLSNSNKFVNELYHNLKGEKVKDYVLQNSDLISKNKLVALLSKSPDEILNSNDPFIKFILNTKPELEKMVNQIREVQATLQVQNQLLGEAVFAAFGNQLAPDATSTLRISDGTIKGYEYNGTLAPGITTFYGLWDRYNSFNKETYPWGLHERWKTPPAELDLTTPIGFASTNDIVGGNSGSSIINTKKEVVGLVHDGNLESLAGTFIFDEENNRTVASDAIGLLASLKYIYKTPKLLKELKTGKLSR